MELGQNSQSRERGFNCRSIRSQTLCVEDAMVKDENIKEIIRSNRNGKSFAIKNILHSSYFGILCAVLSSTFCILSAVILKKVPHFDSLQQTLLASIWLVVGSLPVRVITRSEVFGRSKHSCLAFLRAATGATTIFTAVFASRYLPLPELAIMAAAIPSISTVLARVCLKEQCGAVHVFTLMLTAAGVLLALRLPELLKSDSSARFKAQYIIGLIAQVAFVICMSLSGVLIRMIRDVHFSVQLIHIGLLGSLISACVVAATGAQLPHCGWEALLKLSAGLSLFVGLGFRIVATQTEAVAIVSIMKACADVVCALLFQMVFFQRYPDVYHWCGAVVVMVSVGIIGFHKWWRLRIR